MVVRVGRNWICQESSVLVVEGKHNKHKVLRPSVDKTREELDKLLHTDDVISMHLLCIEFDSELLHQQKIHLLFSS